MVIQLHAFGLHIIIQPVMPHPQRGIGYFFKPCQKTSVPVEAAAQYVTETELPSGSETEQPGFVAPDISGNSEIQLDFANGSKWDIFRAAGSKLSVEHKLEFFNNVWNPDEKHIFPTRRDAAGNSNIK